MESLGKKGRHGPSRDPERHQDGRWAQSSSWVGLNCHSWRMGTAALLSLCQNNAGSLPERNKMALVQYLLLDGEEQWCAYRPFTQLGLCESSCTVTQLGRSSVCLGPPWHLPFHSHDGRGRRCGDLRWVSCGWMTQSVLSCVTNASHVSLAHVAWAPENLPVGSAWLVHDGNHPGSGCATWSLCYLCFKGQILLVFRMPVNMPQQFAWSCSRMQFLGCQFCLIKAEFNLLGFDGAWW